MVKPFPDLTLIQRLRDSRLAVPDHFHPNYTGSLIGLGRPRSDCCRRHIPCASPSGVSIHGCVCRLDVITCDRPAAPKQSAKRGTTGELVTIGPMNSPSASPGASLEVSHPFSTPEPRRLPVVQRRPALGRSPWHVSYGAARDGSDAFWGGSFRDVSHGDDATPIVYDLAAQVRSVKPVSSRSPKILPCRATPFEPHAVRPRHAPSRLLSARCSATRFSGHPRPCRAICASSFLP